MIKKSSFTAPFKPYNDTFNENDNIVEVLFKPSDNIYPSDLNLLQTLIQDQISLLGSYFLTPDSIATGGQYKIHSSDSVSYDTNTFTLSEGYYLKSTDSSVIIKVLLLHQDTEFGTNYFFFKVVSGNLTRNETTFYLYNTTTLKVDKTKSLIITSFLKGLYIEFVETVFFIEGTFVYSPAQKVTISINDVNPSCSIGFNINKSIIIKEDDVSLIDNAVTYASFNAPGADRYQILAQLKVIDEIIDHNLMDVTVRGSFLEFLRIKNGVVIKDVRVPIHTEFEKTLAKRTDETSGSYTVKPFRIKLEEGDPSNFLIRIFPGKAYVKGYEIETLTEVKVLLPRLSNQSYYRFDKLIVDTKGNFSLINGVESSVINIPKDNVNALLLYKFLLKPGCISVTSVGISYIDNKRYTMRDIGKIEKRIENMEYYTQLSLLEKETSDMLILDEQGNNRYKNGFFVDNFKTYKTVDLFAHDNKFSLDLAKGELRPSFIMRNFKLNYDEINSNGVVRTGDLITLPFTELVAIEQNDVSTFVSVNPYECFKWEGKITLTPQNDYWVDTTVKPDLNIKQYSDEDIWTAMGEQGFNLEWASWDTKILNSQQSTNDNDLEKLSTVSSSQILWNPSVDSTVDKDLLDKYTLWVNSGFVSGFAKQPDGYVNGDPAVYMTTNEKEIKSVSLSSSILTQSLGKNITSIEIAPYIRPQVIKFEGNGFKPNSTLYAFFGNKEITNACTLNDTDFGVLQTDTTGSIIGYFYLPDKTFTTGSYNFKLTDDRTPTAQLTTTYGITQFFAKGMSSTVQETFISTRQPELLASKIDIPITIETEFTFNTAPPNSTGSTTTTTTNPIDTSGWGMTWAGPGQEPTPENTGGQLATTSWTGW